LIDPAVVFNDLLPDLAEASNGFAWACCPFHDDSNPSFSVNLRTGWYRCFSTSCGQAGPNIVSFVSALLGLSHAAARRHTEARYGR
jgi:DNA primase